MLLDKSHLPLVAVASMNDTHFEEVDLLNRLHNAIQQYATSASNTAQLNTLLDEFEAHIVAHFAGEEQLMLKAGFPAYPVHKGEHDRVLDGLREQLQAYRTRGDLAPIADYLTQVYPTWVRNHIATMDTMTAYFIVRTSDAEIKPGFTQTANN